MSELVPERCRGDLDASVAVLGAKTNGERARHDEGRKKDESGGGKKGGGGRDGGRWEGDRFSSTSNRFVEVNRRSERRELKHELAQKFSRVKISRGRSQ